MSRSFQGFGLALQFFCALGIAPSSARAVDATFAGAPYKNSAPAGKDALPYDVEYAAAALELRASPDTPEADALPGEFFFLEGAHAFLKKEYAFAIQMYQAAASWAYKPAEYNLGVMYARGQGIAVDLPRGMAWMALAAERNEPQYVEAREAVYAEMSKEQFDEANAIWRELKKTYGDAVALRRAKARWAEVRSRATGSHVGAVGNLEVSGPSGSRGSAGSPANPAFNKGLDARERVARQASSSIKGFTITSSGPTTPGEVTGGHGVDGSVAYGRLRQSDDPYDPKFRSAIGTAVVGPVSPVNAGANTNKEAASEGADAAHDDH